MKPARHLQMNSFGIRANHDGWGAEERRKLLVGIERGVWTLSSAAHRFCLAQDEIARWQRFEFDHRPRARDERGAEHYVELV